MRPSSRLELALVAHASDGPEPPLDGIRALLAAWERDGRLDADGGPGPGGGWFGTAFRRIRLDEPGRRALYANRQGGFRVTCPDCGASVVGAFSAAWEGARAAPGALPSIACACGAVHRVDALRFSPPAAFGRAAVVVADAAEPRLSPEADAALREALGPATWVLRRG